MPGWGRNCFGMCSAAWWTTTGTWACAGAWPPTWPAAATRCACGWTTRRHPGQRRRVVLIPWRADSPLPEPGDVVVETFGCDPPEDFVQRMAARPVPPVWANLEDRSAEAYVERSHRLPSPQRNGLTKWFFYPGFTPATGGLLREPGLAERQAAFHRGQWLA
eukprot:gene8902-11904_t